MMCLRNLDSPRIRGILTAMEYRICRLCEESDDTSRLVQYSVRSYAHWKCLLDRKSLEDGIAWIRGLYSHQIRKAPVLIVQDWLDKRGWTGDRAMELLLQAAKEKDAR